MPGALFQGVCYPALESAKQAACSASSTRWGSGDSLLSVECSDTSFASDSMSLCKRLDGGACTTIAEPYPDFPECDFSGGSDLALSWMLAVLPVVAALWGMRVLIRLFSENRSDD